MPSPGKTRKNSHRVRPVHWLSDDPAVRSAQRIGPNYKGRKGWRQIARHSQRLRARF